jgi:transcriptional regulator with XRE-family HTH domain
LCLPASFVDFGSYVRNAREARQLTFDAIAAETKIKRELWSDLEANDLKRWPKEEIYRRGFLRSYADAVGLPADEVLAQFARQFAEPPEMTGIEPRRGHARAFDRTLRRPAFPQWRQFSTHVVLPLGLLLGVAALAFQDRKAPEATHEGQPAAVRSVAQVQRSRSELPAVDVARAVASPPVIPAAPGVATDPKPIPATEVEGTLIVVSDPPEAFITVNGIGRGKTPVTVEFLAFGSYEIRVVRPGYQVSQERLTLDSQNPRKTIKVNLRAVEQPAPLEGDSAR